MNAGSSDYGMIIDANDCPKTAEYPTLPSKYGGDTSNDSSNDLDSYRRNQSSEREGEVDWIELEIQPDSVDLTELTDDPCLRRIARIPAGEPRNRYRYQCANLVVQDTMGDESLDSPAS